jgi:putative intracellular protease/amidase
MQTRDVHVYVFDTMADWEVGHAIGYINTPDYQKQPGRYRVRSVGRTREPVVTTGGLRVTPELTLAELKPVDSAMLILPGGTNWDRTHNDDAAVETARAFVKAGVPVAAICARRGGSRAAGSSTIVRTRATRRSTSSINQVIGARRAIAKSAR